jgi:NAD(P)H-dependent FMN reductase
MKITLISASMAENSRSRILLKTLGELLENEGGSTQWIDLRDIKMEFCDGRKESYGEDVEKAKKILDQSDALVFAYGVYCYSIPASLKNFIDIACSSMNKPFGQVIASGGNNAFLTHEHLSQILKNEVHANAYPSVLFAAYPDYPGGKVENEKLLGRMSEYAKNFSRWANCLSALS